MIDTEIIVLNTLGSDAFVPVNKRLIRHFNGDAATAVFLGELANTYKYHKDRNVLDPDGSFPIPIRRMQKSIGFSAYKQERIIGKLTTEGLCHVYLKGYPASKYAVLNFEALSAILSTDDLLAKKTEQEKFYSGLNALLNARFTYNSEAGVAELDRQCDNMSPTLKGVIILLSKLYLDNFSAGQGAVDWAPETVGKINYWIRNKTFGNKRFDFTSLERISKSIPGGHLGVAFKSFISQIIFNSKSTPDVHFSEQIYNYLDVLLPGRY